MTVGHKIVEQRDELYLLLAIVMIQIAAGLVLLLEESISYSQGLIFTGAVYIPYIAVLLHFLTGHRKALIVMLVLSWLATSAGLIESVTFWVMFLPIVLLVQRVLRQELVLAITSIFTLPLIANLIIDEQSSERLVVVAAIALTIGILMNVEQSQDTEPEDRESADHQFRALINSMADGVIATDNNRKVLLYNGSALNILNVNTSLEGQTLDDYLPLKNSRNKSVKITTLLKKLHGILITRDYKLTFKDGDDLNLYIAITEVRPGYGVQGNSGYVYLLRDITKEKSLEEERDEFIAVVSHELRTPTAITEGNISNAMLLLEKKPKKKELMSALEEAHKQAVFLADLINDLSTLSRAERGVLRVEPETVKVNDFLKLLIENYNEDAKAKGLTIKMVKNKANPSVTTSKLYLQEILQNFITNSIKYTNKGGITLSAEKTNNGVSFKVSDTGIGISRSDQKRVFEKFFRSEDYRTRESSGTGLGLYVTMKLVKIIHAKVEVESEVDKGSDFIVSVPDFGDDA